MAIRPFSLAGKVSPPVYALAAPVLLLSQHLVVALAITGTALGLIWTTASGCCRCAAWRPCRG